MKRLAMAVSVVLALAAAGAGRADDAKEPNYYPLKKGNKWTYKVQGAPNSITVTIASVDKDGALLETALEGQVQSTEKVLVKDDGVYRTEVNKMKPDAPIKIVKLPVKKGDSWEIDTKVGAETIKGKFSVREDEVTVAAGKYKAVVVEGKDFEINGQKMNLTTWYVDKVGIVKLSFSLAGTEAVLELEKFEEGK
jgi:hypothetical protein